ncbi:MAG: hypothetical protein GF344_00775 [Chitinivibrionales bacterium]|nr:hypothetical protein [Chitinivibrionales bacterium]
MNAIEDFEDLLAVFEAHRVRYLIVGGLAFIFHAKPRYTKDIDLWIEPAEENVARANKALKDFGAPYALTQPPVHDEVLQIGLPPNRIDLILGIEGVRFTDAWETRIRSVYGGVEANWIGLECLYEVKSKIDSPRHQEDARVLREVIKLREQSRKNKKSD